MSFNETKDIQNARKDHICEQCQCTIPKGFAYKYHYWVMDGSMNDARYHNECYEAWCRENEDACYDEDWWPLFTDWDSSRISEWKKMISKLYTPELFYVGYREIFEKPGRNGYTTDMEEAGRFTFDEAKRMTRYKSAHGKGRWYIAVSALESFANGKMHPTEMY